MQGRRTRRIGIYDLVVKIFLIILIISVLYPLIWLISSSFKYEKDILAYPPKLFAEEYTFMSYKRVFTSIPMLQYIKNTVIFALGVTFFSLIFDSMAGYAFARLGFRGKNILFLVIMITMMVPFQVILIPLFLELNILGILDTYTGLILPKATSAFGIFMMRSFFSSLPKDLEEAARLDGFNEFRIYSKIMLPLVKPGLITLGIFQLMGTWNDLLYPLMMTSSTNMRTLPAGLALFVGERATTYYGPPLAGSLLSIIPLFVLYVFFQKYFTASVASSGLKE